MSPQIRDTTNTTRKRKKSTLAISAEPEAMPPKPKTAEMIAMMKKTAAQRNMDTSFGFGSAAFTAAGDRRVTGQVDPSWKEPVMRRKGLPGKRLFESNIADQRS
jgi:hypothetical protein